ncbi:MAG: radical SAM protein [Deltaproteobacteria bacterium]|nr:radical SAM protein [Deltaproteobacteria bacterium]
MNFSEILKLPGVRERWEKVRAYFFLRESTYDMTNRCNIRCEGCYYYRGDKQFAEESADPEAWTRLFRREKERGITYVVLAGAEPALVPELLQVCYGEIDLGSIATNGIKPIPESVGYKIHVSVWGNDETSKKIRGAADMLVRQMDNYKGDPRAVWVYTFTPGNVEESYEVVETLAQNDCRVTFNMFSSPVGYNGPLRHTRESRARVRRAMLDLMQEHSKHVLFTSYNAVVHTHDQGLHGLFSCPYPRMNPSEAIGLGRSFRQYRTNLEWDRSAACCVPDTDCPDCRHYASGSAVVTARMYRHASDPATFRSWLDYVDNYLAVWVMGYEKGENLCRDLIEPPPPAN